MKTPVKVYGKKFYEAPGKVVILAYIVDRCNYGCEYCYNKTPRSGVELDFEKLYEFVKQVLSQRSFVQLDLIGGETTLHGRLEEYVGKLTALGNIEVSIFTNFSRPFEYYRKLVDLGARLLISYHCQADPEEFVGKLRMFDDGQVENSLSLAVMYEPGRTDRAKQVFDAVNQALPKLPDLELTWLLSTDRCKCVYTGSETSDFARIKQKEKTPPVTIEYDDGTSIDVNDSYFFKDFRNMNFKYWKCNAGLDFLYVHWNGDVHPCDENDETVLHNIYSGKPFEFGKRQLICRRDICPCLFDVYKERIFKR